MSKLVKFMKYFTTFKHSGENSPLLIPKVKTCEVYESIHHYNNFTLLINKNFSTFKVVKFHQCFEEQALHVKFCIYFLLKTYQQWYWFCSSRRHDSNDIKFVKNRIVDQKLWRFEKKHFWNWVLYRTTTHTVWVAGVDKGNSEFLILFCPFWLRFLFDKGVLIKCK